MNSAAASFDAVLRRCRATERGAVAALEQMPTPFKSKELGALKRRLVDSLEQTVAGEPGGSHE